MKRTYTKTNWVNNKTQIDAEKLNNIETGIEGLYTDALSLSNFIEGSSISIGAVDGGDVKISLRFNRLSECPANGDGGNTGDYYQDEEHDVLYFCLAPGNWIILTYSKFR